MQYNKCPPSLLEAVRMCWWDHETQHVPIAVPLWHQQVRNQIILRTEAVLFGPGRYHINRLTVFLGLPLCPSLPRCCDSPELWSVANSAVSSWL